MYQLEVKRWLVEHYFPPKCGWKVTVDVDAMERAKGGTHAADKRERAAAAETALRELGVTVGAHPEFGRADVVAEHADKGTFVVEVEGRSSRQKEQALYSALGQLVLQMQGSNYQFVLAVPDDGYWERQLRKVPDHARNVLGLSCVLVSQHGVRDIRALLDGHTP